MNRGAIFLILFAISFSFTVPAYADHRLEENRDKSAYVFKVTGFAQDEFWGIDVDGFIRNNNGVVHWAQWNSIDFGSVDNGEQKNRGCVGSHPPAVRLPDAPRNDWKLVTSEFTEEYHNYAKYSEFHPNHPAKLMMMGFSFGGGATIFTVDNEKNHDVPFDLVYTADPVGPNGNRINVIHEHGIEHSPKPCVGNDDPGTLFIEESFPPCPSYLPISNDALIAYAKCEQDYVKDKREIPPNVKFFLNRWQIGEDEDGKILAPQKRIPPADNLRSPAFDGKFLTHPKVESDQAVHPCDRDGTLGGLCHSQVAFRTDIPVINILEKMNTAPVISSPSQIHINEGSSASLKISATDKPTKWDKGMTVNFRMDPLQSTEKSAINFTKTGNSFSGIFLMGDLDGPSEKTKELQVEDNGFPCNGCTDGGNGQVAAKGSKGMYDRGNFLIIVDNVPPIIDTSKYLLNGFEASLHVEASDPSTADMQAGFDYEIDWGDGTVDYFPVDSITAKSHLYKSGEYDISIIAIDKDGGVSDPTIITVQTPFHNFSDNIDDLVNDGTLNKGQGNSFNQKTEQLIQSFEKANSKPACNQADAFINEVNAFVNSDKFTPDQGNELIENIETEKSKAGCDSENIFSNIENSTDENKNNLKSNNRNQSNESKNGQNNPRFFNVNIDSGSSDSQTSDIVTDDHSGSGGDEHLTRPTFGLSHETYETIVDSGFRFNEQSFTINDNHHTLFSQQTVDIGEVNSFEAKIYADKGLRVQEFLFGIPNIGEAHLAELGVEVWYDYNGEIKDVKAIQKSNVIDKDTIVASHEKTKCQESDIEEKCDLTKISMVFLEPLKDKVMAVKAIDNKNRYQITYLNEGIEIAGDSLNPMNTLLISSNEKDVGLMQVTQTSKYSPYWISQDGRIFEMNSFGSFKQIGQTFERFHDNGNPYTRVHSEFGKLIEYEQKRAYQLFDSSELISELPEIFAYFYPDIHNRVTDQMEEQMHQQEEIAKEILEKSKVQARW